MTGKLLAATAVAAVLTVSVVVAIIAAITAGPVTPLDIARVIIGLSLISGAIIVATTSQQ